MAQFLHIFINGICIHVFYNAHAHVCDKSALSLHVSCSLQLL